MRHYCHGASRASDPLKAEPVLADTPWYAQKASLFFMPVESLPEFCCILVTFGHF